MIDINLLPWRHHSFKQILRRLLMGCAVILLLGIGGMWFYVRAHQQRLQLQIDRGKQMQLEITKLRSQRRVHSTTPKSPEVEPFLLPITPKPPIADSLQMKMVRVHYAKVSDLALLFRDRSNALLSKKGKVTADPRTNLLWLEDTPDHIKKSVAVIKQLDVPAQQIVIEARLVTMNQESARDLGIRLGIISPKPPSTGAASDNTRAPITPGGRLGLDLAAIPMDATAATLGFTEARLISQRLLDMELSALESAGQAKVIASPRLITSNQIPSLIESGEDIPYQEFGANGTTSVSFKKAVLRLKVVPQMTMKQELMMSLLINQDSDSGKRVQGVPIITTKAIETHILVHNGQTIVLGGIYQEDHSNQADQVPFLGNIPVLGALFKRTQQRVRHETLLIFITPRIV